MLPSCCSPRPTPLLLFGCLVPALPKSRCTDPSVPLPVPRPCWSCLCLSPASFSSPPLACSLVCAKSVQCWLCQVNYCHPCCWSGQGGAVQSQGSLWLPQPSSCLHGHTTRAGQGGSANPSSFQVVLKGEGRTRSPVWLQSRDFESWNHILYKESVSPQAVALGMDVVAFCNSFKDSE